MIRFIWLIYAAAAALAVSATPQCKHYTTEELLDRIDSHLALCLPDARHAATLDAFKDVLIANEYQTVGDRQQNQQQPLSVVVFGSAVSSLELFASSVTTAIVGVHPARHSVRVIDFATVLADASASNFDLQNQLRQQLASALASCPQRTLFLVRNVQLAVGDRLPLLDVFLDPMNGDRAQLHDADNDRVLDSRRSIFLFLYHTTGALPSTRSWREFLVAEWQSSVSASLNDVAFTPRALTGRLSGTVQLEGETPTVAVGDAKRWREVCSLPHFVGRLVGTTNANTHSKSGSIVSADVNADLLAWVPAEIMGIFFAMLAVLVVFNRAKCWSGSVAKEEPEVVTLVHSSVETTTITSKTVEVATPPTDEAPTRQEKESAKTPPTPTPTPETPTPTRNVTTPTNKKDGADTSQEATTKSVASSSKPSKPKPTTQTTPPKTRKRGGRNKAK